MVMPTASVIISNYNYAHFLPYAVRSALEQTYPNVEVIVVDDGSVDDSRVIVESFGARVKSIFKDNGGMASVWNAGFKASIGELIVFLDADDILHPSAVEDAMRVMDSGTVTKVHWPLWEMDASGSKSGRLVPDQELPQGNYRDATIRLGPDASISPPTSGNAWARWFLERVLPMPEPEFRRHSDTYLYTIAPIFGEIRRINEPRAGYRVHGTNDYACRPSDEKNRRNLEMFEVRCKILSRFLCEMGIQVDTEQWKRANKYYGWMQAFDSAATDIKSMIPHGEPFILADSAQWGEGWGGSEVIGGYRAIPFIERDGKYWGPPADGSAAIEELRRHAACGVKYTVIAWPAFWLLDCYPALAEYLAAEYRLIRASEHLRIFKLKKR